MIDSKLYLLNRIKRLLWDISGAYGDIGVLLPISIALITKNGFNPVSLFLMAGLFYIVSAYYFKITMPVQPLKAMSAIAIVTGLGCEIINTAGIILGIILLILSITNFSKWIGNIFPVPVIRGIQVGVGLMLIKTSINLINTDFNVAIIAGAVLIICILVKRIPPLIPILILGIIISLNEINPLPIEQLKLIPVIPDINHLWIALTMLVLPQIGLTIGNAIVATEATGQLLYKERAQKLTFTNISTSIGIANIISGFMGGVPMCHGSGGLTAHNKFGATSEKSGYIIGFTLVGFAISCNTSVLFVIFSFPEAILGILLCYVGIQHTLFIKDILKVKTSMFIALTVAVSGFITNNITMGFLLGIGIHYIFEYLEKRGSYVHY